MQLPPSSFIRDYGPTLGVVAAFIVQGLLQWGGREKAAEFAATALVDTKKADEKRDQLISQLASAQAASVEMIKSADVRLRILEDDYHDRVQELRRLARGQ